VPPRPGSRGGARPPVYADENVSRRLTDALRERGFDVLAAREAGTLGQDDDAQLAFAAAAGRVLLSFDRHDFRRTHTAFLRRGGQHPGIVLLPQGAGVARSAIRTAMLLDWLAAQGPAAGLSPLLNWNDLQRALHGGFRPPGYSEHEVLVALGGRDP
jgi:predicted nuclease of predicted toxin-antitoxin system